MYLFVRGFFPGYVPVSGSGRLRFGREVGLQAGFAGSGWEKGAWSLTSQRIFFPRSSARERSDDCQVDDGVDVGEGGDG